MCVCVCITVYVCTVGVYTCTMYMHACVHMEKIPGKLSTCDKLCTAAVLKAHTIEDVLLICVFLFQTSHASMYAHYYA